MAQEANKLNCFQLDRGARDSHYLLPGHFHGVTHMTTYPNLFNVVLDCEYAQKYIARDGATPTKFGPSPLKSARGPSFCTMCLK